MNRAPLHLLPPTPPPHTVTMLLDAILLIGAVVSFAYGVWLLIRIVQLTRSIRRHRP